MSRAGQANTRQNCAVSVTSDDNTRSDDVLQQQHARPFACGRVCVSWRFSRLSLHGSTAHSGLPPCETILGTARAPGSSHWVLKHFLKGRVIVCCRESGDLWCQASCGGAATSRALVSCPQRPLSASTASSSAVLELAAAMAGVDGDDAGLRLMVPVRSFTDEFMCPICFEPVTDCVRALPRSVRCVQGGTDR